MISCPILLNKRLEQWIELHKKNKIKSIAETKNSDYIIEYIITYK